MKANLGGTQERTNQMKNAVREIKNALREIKNGKQEKFLKPK